MKRKVKSLDEVDEKYRDQYSKGEDGWFYLTLDDEGGDGDSEGDIKAQLQEFKEKLAEFRDNNKQLFNENKRLKERMSKAKGVEDIDPDLYKQGLEALKMKEEIENKKLIEEGKIEELLEKRIQTMKADYEKQVKAKSDALTSTSEERDVYKKRLMSHVVDSQVQEMATKVGKVRSGALTDILRRGREAWTMDEHGEIAPMPGKELFGKSGDKMTLKEWAESLLEDAPFLFEPAQGGNSQGGNKGNDARGPQRKVQSGDPISIGRNLESIAKGETVVVGGGYGE